MSQRHRVLLAGDHPSIAWADTLEALAEAHRSRRAADDTARWPLAHACSHRPRTADVEGVPDTVVPNDTGSARGAFGCRALA
jgi:hypothetical protein